MLVIVKTSELPVALDELHKRPCLRLGAHALVLPIARRLDELREPRAIRSTWRETPADRTTTRRASRVGNVAEADAVIRYLPIARRLDELREANRMAAALFAAILPIARRLDELRELARWRLPPSEGTLPIARRLDELRERSL